MLGKARKKYNRRRHNKLRDNENVAKGKNRFNVVVGEEKLAKKKHFSQFSDRKFME